MKRISFTERDAAHIYEWLRMYWDHDVEAGETDRFGNCPLCTLVGKRLEKFIGPAEVRQAARVVRKHPSRR